jgi:sarcosine oxidase subunit gamma
VAENIMREPACPESCRSGKFGSPLPRAGITFAARTGLTLVDLRGDPQNPEFLASAQAALGCVLPLQPNTSAAGADCSVLWLGPDAWLVVAERRGKINERVPIEHGFLTDVSHGRAAWRMGGAHALDLLAKGVSLDLHPRVFLPGHCAQTSLAHVGVLLHLRETNNADLYCARSYAQHLWHWLTEAAGEYGYEVVAPAGV